MDNSHFDVKKFFADAENKIGTVREVSMYYDESDGCRAMLTIMATNGKRELLLHDYYGDTVVDFYFGHGADRAQYEVAKQMVKDIRGYIVKYYPDVKVDRETKCSFAWFD